MAAKRWVSMIWPYYQGIINGGCWIIIGVVLAVPSLHTFKQGIMWKSMPPINEEAFGMGLALLGIVQASLASFHFSGKIKTGLMFADAAIWWFWGSQFIASNPASPFGYLCFFFWFLSFLTMARLLRGKDGETSSAGTLGDSSSILIGERCPLPYTTLLAQPEEGEAGGQQGQPGGEERGFYDSIGVGQTPQGPTDDGPGRKQDGQHPLRRATDFPSGTPHYPGDSEKRGRGPDSTPRKGDCTRHGTAHIGLS